MLGQPSIRDLVLLSMVDLVLLSMVKRTCNPKPWKVEAGREDQNFKAILYIPT